jgi:hypothetical protein
MSQKQEHTVEDHIRYTNEQIAKHLALLEEHFKSYPCGECINKHLLTVEGYAEEGLGMNGKEPYETVRSWARKAMTREDLRALLIEARELRRKLQGEHSHDYTKAIDKHFKDAHGVNVEHCEGPKCPVSHGKAGN